MPLWVKPDHLLTVKDIASIMRDHYEGTPMDMSKDLGAGPFQLPYRWRGLNWKVDSTTYLNERAIATQQTGFSFVAQSRSWLPDPVGGIFWFGVDDANSNCFVPMYCGITDVPECFRVGNGDMLTYSETSAFWTFNQVSNFAYLRYNDMISDVKKVQSESENKFFSFVSVVDKAAVTLLEGSDPSLARKFLTEYSVNEANQTTLKWKKLYQYLLVKYMDGNVKKEENGRFKRTNEGIAVYPDQPGYPEWWYRAIANSTGDKLKVPAGEK
jgi:dipeptidase